VFATAALACASRTDVVAPATETAGRVADDGARAPSALNPRGGLAWRNYFPNVELTTHNGDRVRFYDDLIKGKVVVINFMYATCTDS
jgi:protein SCO1/2